MTDTDAAWTKLKLALDFHRSHEGTELEIHDVGGSWADVRDFIPTPEAEEALRRFEMPEEIRQGIQMPNPLWLTVPLWEPNGYPPVSGKRAFIHIDRISAVEDWHRIPNSPVAEERYGACIRLVGGGAVMTYTDAEVIVMEIEEIRRNAR